MRGGAVAVTLGTLLGAGLVASLAPPAGATQAPTQAGLSEQAQQLQAQIVSDGASLHKMADALAAEQAHLAATDNAIAAGQATLAGLQAELAQASETLRAIAVDQYTQDADSAQLTDFNGSPDQIAAGATYRQLATANESEAVAAFDQAQVAVERQQAQLDAARASASAAYASLNAQYAGLKSAAARLQGELDNVHAEQAALGPPAGIDLANLAGGNGSLAEDLYRLRVCESGDNYQDNTGNGYYGAYQFSPSTWQGLGYSGLPSDAPPPEQDQAAIRLEQADGWGEWPACAAMLGLD